MFWFLSKQKKKKERQLRQVDDIFRVAILMAMFILSLKYMPMYLWGSDILFDASLHITAAFFVLYVIWFFIDQTKEFRYPFYLFAILVLFVISIQRIAVDAHNDIGLLLGALISIISIGLVEREKLGNKIDF